MAPGTIMALVSGCPPFGSCSLCAATTGASTDASAAPLELPPLELPPLELPELPLLDEPPPLLDDEPPKLPELPVPGLAPLELWGDSLLHAARMTSETSAQYPNVRMPCTYHAQSQSQRTCSS
jgi:hypothetical protein